MDDFCGIRLGCASFNFFNDLQAFYGEKIVDGFYINLTLPEIWPEYLIFFVQSVFIALWIKGLTWESISVMA